jgi:hypothetical protein
MASMAADRDYSFKGPEGLLAHYTKASVAFEHILPKRELRMGAYRDMQDPAENKDIVPGTAFYGDPPHAEERWLAAIDGIKQIRDSCRLLCLTHDAEGATDTFGCCWARPRMWEQYGERHRGVCLLFDRARLHDVLPVELAAHGAFYLGDVRYTEAGIAESATRSFVDDRIFGPDLAERDAAIDDYIQLHHQDFFFLKSDDFSTEHEYRAVVMAPGEDDYVYVDYRDALVAVVVGERFPDWQFAGTKEICDEAGAVFRCMHWHQGQPYALDAMAVKRARDRRRALLRPSQP